jgi:hypothetical protein
MPRIFLTDETYIAANDGSEIFGSAGSEQVVLQAGVGQVNIASNIERLDLPGDLADYTFSSFGAALTVRTPAGDIVATVSDAGGKQIGFADGVQDVAFDPGSFTLSLGGVPLDGTPAPVDPDAPAPTYSLTADAASVDEGEVAGFSLATTHVDAGTVVDYTITGVQAADISGGLTGSATIGTDGTADIAVQVLADQLTEGVETLTLSLDTGAATASTQVQDTSVADAGSYISGQGGNGVVSAFNIELVFDSVFTTDQRDAFEIAADYLSSLITSDLPDEGAIDDVRITAELEPIDGEFGVLGSAGPDWLRTGSLLPYEGGMRFDTADADRELAEGSFVDTVAHEMLHVLGFGTIWEDTELDLLSGDTDLRFTGDNAIAAYNAEFPGIAGPDANSALGVPVETEGGEGTARGHWDEDVFTNELMTGYGMAGIDDYMGGMTVAALEDMGYDTVFDVGLPGAAMPQLDDFVMA